MFRVCNRVRRTADSFRALYRERGELSPSVRLDDCLSSFLTSP